MSFEFIKKLPFIYQAKTSYLFTKRFGIGLEQSKILLKYITASLFQEKNDQTHLDAAMKWLAHSQDVDPADDGCSSVFYLKDGWGASYPETSGYILATYFAYAELTGDQSYVKRAIAIGDWEIKIQATNGGVYSNPEPGNIRVFNTGQVMLGWFLLFENTEDQKYLDAAIRAGDYLTEVQEDDGSWLKDTYSGPRTYESRVDWALIKLAQLSGYNSYSIVAKKNLQWILSKQRENGWFDSSGFKDELPIMHVIIYTLRGLLECEMTGEETIKELELMKAITKAVDVLCEAAKTQFVNGIEGMMPCAFDENWNGVMSDSCLTGNAQFVILLYRLAHIVEDNEHYLKTADIVLSATKRTQILDTSLKDIKGALPGTFPLYQGYVHDGYPNWATKFLADALLMKIGYEKEVIVKA